MSVRERPYILERHPKARDRDEHGPELELVDAPDGMKYRFRDTGIRVEIDGQEYVPDAIASVDGYVLLRPAGDKPGMVKGGDDHPEVKLHVDMSSMLQATGGRNASSTGGGEDG
jgi:hypothetical protein